MSHTPGEWTVRYDIHGAEIKGPRGESVAWCGDNYSTDTGSVPFRANARLIAAAPDLLEALEFMVNCTEDEINDAYRRAKAAITKAEGRD